MAEGVAVADRVTAGGVHDNADAPPPPGPDAPKGWTWNRKGGHWQPKERGKILWHASGADAAAGDGAQADDTSPAQPRDPAPAWMGDPEQDSSSGGGKPKPAKVEVTQKVRDDVGGILGFAGALLLPPMVRADPHCGGALAQNWGQIADACIPLISRSQTVVRWLTTDSGGLMDWLGLAVALAPVGRAVLEHHVVKTVQVVENEDGERVAQPADYSQFTAAAA